MGHQAPRLDETNFHDHVHVVSMVVSLVGVALAELLTAAGVDEHAPAFTGGAA